MGKKTKTGKNRLDKFYHLAKDSGYRSRAAFKLIQLNKKFDFLSKSRVLIDLCAAPGSWLQVASKFMPAGSSIIGVDLVGIKQIPNVTSFKSDITTPECRAKLKSLLKGGKADTILHDGAPNVGGNWVKDAYNQSDLTLSALKLATEFLCAGGMLVTKVFRSADYNSLLWAFHQLFRRVVSTKPVASRNTSAEIYVICEGYLNPKKLDPRLLDPRSVFKELSEGKVVNIFSKKKAKPNKLGYEGDSMLLYKKCSFLEFIQAEDPIKILAEYNEVLPTPIKEGEDKEEIQLYLKHPNTTEEIVTCLADLKVLNSNDFKKLLSWRKEMRKFAQLDEPVEPKKEEKIEDPLDDPNLTPEQKQILLQQLMEDSIVQRDRRKQKKEKKKVMTQKKLMMRMGLKSSMDDEFEAPVGEGLFSLRAIKDSEGLRSVAGLTEDEDAPNEEELDLMNEADIVVSKEKIVVKQKPRDEDILSESDDDLEELGEGEGKDDAIRDKYLDLLYERYVSANNEYRQKMSKRERKNRAKKDPIPDDLNDFSQFAKRYNNDELEEDEDLDDGGNTNELILGPDQIQEGAAARASMWFDSELFQDVEGEDEDKAVETMLENRQPKKRKRGEEGYFDEVKVDDSDLVATKKQKLDKGGEESVEDDEEDEPDTPMIDTEDEKESKGFEEVPTQEDFSDYDSDDQAEMLAVGGLLKDPTYRSNVVDQSFNKYVFGDDPDALPRWFVDDEKKFQRPLPPVTKEEVDEMKRQIKAIDARPIHKVAEAQARKKKHFQAKLTKARARTKAIASNSEISDREKLKQIQKLYKGTLAKVKKDKVYVVSRKHATANKSTGNVKTKLVDPRMKKDKRGRKRADARNKFKANRRKAQK